MLAKILSAAVIGFDGSLMEILKIAVLKLYHPARSNQIIIKISRTIADLDGSKEIKQNRIAKNLQCRLKN